MAYNEKFPFSKTTKKMLDYLPSWMSMRTHTDTNGNRDSLGAQFLNTGGIEFEVIENYLSDILNNQFLETAIVGQIDYIWKFDVHDVLITFSNWTILVFTGKLKDYTTMDDEGNEIIITHPEQFSINEYKTFEEFYLADETCCMVDYDNGICYVRRDSEGAEFEYILVEAYDDDGNGGYLNFSEFAVHHVWNAFDEIGLILGLPRLIKEDNTSYKNRLKTVFSNPGGPTKESLKNGIANLLGISQNEIALEEFSDAAFKKSLLNADGSASESLKKYARIINEQIANTWDHMNWDRAYWKALQDSKLGFEYLPHVWNASIDGWKNEDFQSGIGSGLDLFVKAPAQETNEQSFQYYIGAEAVINNDEVRYPAHEFNYKISAKGTRIETTSKVEEFKYTIVASEVHTLDNKIKVNAHKEYNLTPIIEWDTETMDVGLERVNSNLISSPSGTIDVPRNYFKVTASLETNSVATPQLNSLTIGWKDTSDAEHTLVLDAQIDFERSDDLSAAGPYPLIDVEKTNTLTGNGYVELGYGSFQHVIDSDEDWRDGTMTNCYTQGGSLKLINRSE